MDARYYNGDEDRDIASVEDRCDVCNIELVAAETDDGRCRRCTQDAYDAGDDDGEAFRGDEAAGYERDCQDDARSLK